jgi:hypothetical protein
VGYLDSIYPSQAGDTRYSWWEAAPDDADLDEEYVENQRASSLLSCARRLENAQAEIHQQNLWSAQLYSNRELAAFDWGTGQLYRASLAPITRTGENITVRVVDTMVSQVGKNRPKPKPVARGASFSTRQQIRLLDKFLYGEFQRNEAYEVGKQAFRDACIFGLGAIKVGLEKSEDHGDRLCYERVFPDEILVDQMEVVACGKIRHFYRRRVLPIEVVGATYGLSDEEMDELVESQSAFTYLDYRPIGRGWVVVVEGYQLAQDKSPGRWMVATQNCVLDEGVWPNEWLPYVFFHWQVPVSGFYSPSIVEQVLPYQIRLNEVNEVIRDAQDVMARPRILVAEGSRVNPLEIDNVVGRFIKYTGIKPEAITWPAMSAELYNERDRLVRTCLEQFGLSALATSVTPPPGARFDSSPAFREFNAIQDDRLSDPAQRFEKMYIDLAKRSVQVLDHAGANPQTVWYSGYKQSKAEVIKWHDIGHDIDSYVMSLEATSIYSMSPAGARDELEKQLAMGLITPEQYRMELCDPDQESEYSLAAAASEDINRVLEVLESGEFETPTPEQDLVNGVNRITLGLLNLNKYKDVPAETKLNFINWITLAKAILQRGTEPENAPSVPGAGGDGTAVGDAQAAMGMPGLLPGPGGPLGNPGTVPVPEAAGLAVAQPGRAPRLSVP